MNERPDIAFGNISHGFVFVSPFRCRIEFFFHHDERTSCRADNNNHHDDDQQERYELG